MIGGIFPKDLFGYLLKFCSDVSLRQFSKTCKDVNTIIQNDPELLILTKVHIHYSKLFCDTSFETEAWRKQHGWTVRIELTKKICSMTKRRQLTEIFYAKKETQVRDLFAFSYRNLIATRDRFAKLSRTGWKKSVLSDLVAYMIDDDVLKIQIHY